MKPRLLQLLVCPVDRTPLDLIEWESGPSEISAEEIQKARRLGIEPAELSREIVTGVLVNRRQKIVYPIYRGIPRLLVFETGVSREFWRQYGGRIGRELPGFRAPSEGAMPGEEDVLRSFSTEWTNYGWDGRSYWGLTPEALHRSMDFLLDLGRTPVRGQRVLEVGIGIGSTADYVTRSNDCEMVGIDLSYAVDAAYKPFARNSLLHIVQASAFRVPFPDKAFDFVYSFGVLHHTFSTREAFRSISCLPRAGGRLFVWVYSPFDETRTMERRMLMRLENALRPIYWRLPTKLQTLALLPFLPLYRIHQALVRKKRGPEYVHYGWREAMHAARDRFTHRFAHRHDEEEVSGWFAEAGYGDLRFVTPRSAPDFVPTSFVACTGVEGTRQATAGCRSTDRVAAEGERV